MGRKTKYLYVISLDGLSSLDFDYISSLPNFSEFLKNASYSKIVYSVYPSLTYPAHATIVTGKYPKNHGVINNTLFQPERKSPDWNWFKRYIKGDNLFDMAINNGMKVASLLWPVTGKSRIQYNMPEIFANRPWENQIIVSLKSGSPLYQIELNRMFGHLRDGKNQPNLDNFVHQAFLYTINNKRPDITFVHYTDIDTIRHKHGFNSMEAIKALERHDERLGDIVKTLKTQNIYEESTIIILGDHSSLDSDKIINLNVLLKNKGYIEVNEKGKIKDFKAIIKACDGSAYLYLKNRADMELKKEISKLIEKFNRAEGCIEKVYTSSEAEAFGADPECTLMLEAGKGYYFSDNINGEIIKKIQYEEAGRVSGIHINTHGYSPYKKDYTTVFMASGKGIKKNIVIDKMNLVDEGPTIANLMGFELQNADGRVIREFLE